MEISRNVILDLLPLYFANELSDDSRKLVEKHLKDDPQLGRLAKQSAGTALSDKMPVPLTQNDELIAYRRARQAIMWRTIAIAAAIAVFLVLVLVMYLSSSSASDGSCPVVERTAPLRTPGTAVMEVAEDPGAINRSVCEIADLHIVAHERDAHDVSILMLLKEDGHIADNCITTNLLTLGAV
jgi:hypothetical protein